MHSMYGLAWTRSMTGLADWRVGGDATRGRPAPKKEAGSEPDRPLMEDSYYSLLYWFLGLLVEVRGLDERLARTLVPGRWACPGSWFSVLSPLCWSTKFKVVCCAAWILATEEEAGRRVGTGWGGPTTAIRTRSPYCRSTPRRPDEARRGQASDPFSHANLRIWTASTGAGAKESTDPGQRDLERS